MADLGVLAFETGWGWAAAALSEHGVVAFEMPGDSPDDALARLLRRQTAGTCQPDSDGNACGLSETPTDDHAAEQLVREVRLYIQHSLRDFKTPVDLRALPPFRRRVLDALRRIPFGATVTYGALAARVGNSGAARAVGGALASNPVPLLVPCHRVIASGGALGGFSAHGGASLKRRLLEHEGVTL